MHFMSHGLFWGLLVVLFGLSIIAKAIFKIDIPVFRTILGLYLIFWGFKMVFGGFGVKTSDNSVIFGNYNIKGSKIKSEHNIVFSSGTIDLNDVDLSEGSVRTEIDVVFGSADIYLNPEIPAVVRVENVFSDTKMPGRSISFFGNSTYKTPSYVEGENFLKVSIDVVFGAVRIIE